MTDRPIIFSAPMVRALLEGRKTQTRRLLRSAVPEGHFVDRCPYVSTGWSLWTKAQEGHAEGCTCRPFKGVPWQVGDALWVREDHRFQEVMGGLVGVSYRADPGQPVPTYLRPNDLAALPAASKRDRPSIHMPRWASRLTLLVTEVRIQRLQDISDEDCLAEGCIRLPASGRITDAPGGQYAGRLWGTPSAWYRELWDALHGEGSWSTNPVVVALTFQVTRANIDTITNEAA